MSRYYASPCHFRCYLITRKKYMTLRRNLSKLKLISKVSFICLSLNFTNSKKKTFDNGLCSYIKFNSSRGFSVDFSELLRKNIFDSSCSRLLMLTRKKYQLKSQEWRLQDVSCYTVLVSLFLVFNLYELGACLQWSVTGNTFS